MLAALRPMNDLHNFGWTGGDSDYCCTVKLIATMLMKTLTFGAHVLPVAQYIELLPEAFQALTT